jgi:hypothetical protein
VPLLPCRCRKEKSGPADRRSVSGLRAEARDGWVGGVVAETDDVAARQDPTVTTRVGPDVRWLWRNAIARVTDKLRAVAKCLGKMRES